MISESVKVYDNIFHCFGSGEEILQSENNITKALINVFEHSHIDLRRNFLLEELKLEGNLVIEPMNFDLQVKKPLGKRYKKAFVLGISDKKPKANAIEEVKDDNEGVPDAAFISNDLCMLIEVKVRDTKLTLEQIKRHENLFADEQFISEPIFKTWNDMLVFLGQQQESLQGDKYSVTRFLIDQFINYCAINGVGPNKSKDFYLMCFPSSIRQLARDINNYISNKYQSELDQSRPAKSRGISYTRKGRKGFFAKLETVAHILILSFEPTMGDTMQERLDQLGIGKERNKNATSWITPDREAWIDLNKVDSLDEIKVFIDEAFNKRP